MGLLKELITSNRDNDMNRTLDWNGTSMKEPGRSSTASDDRDLRQPDQARRDAYKNRYAIEYDPDRLLNAVFGRKLVGSTSGASPAEEGVMMLVFGLSIAVLASIVLSSVISFSTDFTFLPAVGKCQCTTLAFILISTGLYGLKKWA